METSNKSVLDEAIKDAVTLERMKAREVRDIIKFMRDDFSPDYIEGLNNSLLRIEGLPRQQQLRQLAGITTFLKGLILEKTGQLFDDVILSNAAETASISAIQQVDALVKAVPGEIQNLGFSIKGMTEPAIQEAVSNTLINGSTIQETVARFADDFDGKITQQLRIGISNGETISQLTQRARVVINNKAVNAQTIARTVQTAVSAEVREATFEENEDIVKGYEWVSVLDTRTSTICKALDGTVYKLDDPKRRVPPAHPNCRSTITPVLKSWKELGIKANELSAGSRRTMDGSSISAELDYGDWLKTQKDSVQDEALGKAKAKLFRENNLDMKDFVNRIGEPLTVEEVKANLEKRRKRSSTANKPKAKTKPKPKPKPKRKIKMKRPRDITDLTPAQFREYEKIAGLNSQGKFDEFSRELKKLRAKWAKEA